MVCLSRSCHFKIFKGCLPQIILGPFSYALSHTSQRYIKYIIGMRDKPSAHIRIPNQKKTVIVGAWERKKYIFISNVYFVLKKFL